MPPPDRYPPDDPREWLNRAESNLALAKNRVEGAYLEDLCFQAQQAAEKSIKAVMIRRNIDFPYVHDLRRLLALLQEAGEEIPATVARAENLTRYASDPQTAAVLRWLPYVLGEVDPARPPVLDVPSPACTEKTGREVRRR